MSEILERDAFILRVAVGTAKDDKSGIEYEMCTGVTGDPTVKSNKTGRTFVLSWQDIVEQAVAAGIDEEPGH